MQSWNTPGLGKKNMEIPSVVAHQTTAVVICELGQQKNEKRIYINAHVFLRKMHKL